MKLMTRILSAAVASLALATAAVADDPYKVGFIYVGPVGDFGWSYEHDKGRQAVEAAYGDKVETTYVESVPEGADAERVMTQMALSGHDMIFTTSFGYMDPTINVAKKFPNVKFEHATGYKQADNVSTYSARFYEGRTVIGHIAGNMTETNTVGYIASFPIPEVIRGINAAYLAAKKVNPDVTFKIVWVYTWFDPGKEADAATALIEQGADVIMQHTDSPAAMTIAEEKGIYAFGQASDMVQFGPHARIGSIIDDWAPASKKAWPRSVVSDQPCRWRFAKKPLIWHLRWPQAKCTASPARSTSKTVPLGWLLVKPLMMVRFWATAKVFAAQTLSPKEQPQFNRCQNSGNSKGCARELKRRVLSGEIPKGSGHQHRADNQCHRPYA